MNENRTICFYDLETTGLSVAFDQILRFAAIRTDLALEELERVEVDIKLRPDIIPSAGALIINRLSLNDVLIGDSEYEGICKIHELLNRPGTISAGYNSLTYDNALLRYGFYRNFLDPYLHEWHNLCGKMDILPIVAYYYLFRPTALKWPGDDIAGKLRLENLIPLNRLTDGMAHHAMSDVEATVELSRRLKSHDPELWEKLTSSFNKDWDRSYMLDLPIFRINASRVCSLGAMVRIQFGYDKNLIAPVILLGDHTEYSNQQYWLRLDIKDFSSTIKSSSDTGKLGWSKVKRKLGAPDFIVPIDDNVKAMLGDERVNIMDNNLEWIKNNEKLFYEISNEIIQKTYPERTGLDLDASLYTSGFFNDAEKEIMNEFQNNSVPEKINQINNLPDDRMKMLGLRILGRNYPEMLDEDLKQEFESTFNNSDSNTDISGKKKTSLDDLVKQIEDWRQKELDNDQKNILLQLEKYYAR